MQKKGTLGTVIAGVIAIFLVLVCSFYLSFTFVSSSHEDKAVAYSEAKANAAKKLYAEDTNCDSICATIKDKAYKHYYDSLGEQEVYLGHTLNEVRKWAINLGLDLKGGMSVTIQVDMPGVLTSMSTQKNAPSENFIKALAVADSLVENHTSDNFVNEFINQYKALDSNVDFSALFTVVKAGASDSDVEKALKEEVRNIVENSATNVLRNRIDQFGVVSPNIQVLQGNDGQILLELPGVKDPDRATALLQQAAKLEFYECYPDVEKASVYQQLMAVDATLVADTTNNVGGFMAMLEPAGMQGSVVGYTKNKGNMDKINTVLQYAATHNMLPGNIKLLWSNKSESFTDQNGKTTELGYALYALKTNNGEPALAGDCIEDAYSDYDSKQGNYVSMRMNSDGAREWARITRKAVTDGNNCIAVVLDGLVYSAPRVQNEITGGSSQITGTFTVDEAKDLANVLKSGKMDFDVKIISSMTIGPSLGQEAINSGMLSFVVALVLLMLFMMAYYGVYPGLVANFGLICNLFFTFGILASFQSVLTLSGICGIVLALGMAVDANVLIFERAKEELRAGKNIRTAINDGYSNAFSAIFDSNLTSVITGVILMMFGTGPIKGFATTLIIGIVCSFFTAVYLSRLLFIWGTNTKMFSRITFTTAISKKVFTNANYNFLGQRKGAFIVVFALIAVMVGSLAIRGLNQGIDFSGGRNYVVKFDQNVTAQEIQDKLESVFEGASLSVISIEGQEDGKSRVRISTNYKINKQTQEVEQEIVGKLYDVLTKDYLKGMSKKDFSTSNVDKGLESAQMVGPSVAGDMRTSAYIAIALSLLAMFLYILVRFRNVAFSIGALAAVAFTAFFIIGVYSISYGFLPFAMEIDQTFIAAILTVIGYQINDTVVVFDRVRENIGLYPKQDFFTTINKSINSTLGRTVMTSGTTLLVLLVIFILGAESIRSFVFAMLVGVIVGTLATIYVASPVAYLTDSRRKAKKAAAEKVAKELKK
ncbi:MAG: protein translocase subunit SecD [Muribaculaceae bacterium]|nr:protein translocase subunit SecD [Muribaculaceae bacterium]